MINTFLKNLVALLVLYLVVVLVGHVIINYYSFGSILFDSSIIYTSIQLNIISLIYVYLSFIIIVIINFNLIKTNIKNRIRNLDSLKFLGIVAFIVLVLAYASYFLIFIRMDNVFELKFLGLSINDKNLLYVNIATYILVVSFLEEVLFRMLLVKLNQRIRFFVLVNFLFNCLIYFLAFGFWAITIDLFMQYLVISIFISFFTYIVYYKTKSIIHSYLMHMLISAICIYILYLNK